MDAIIQAQFARGIGSKKVRSGEYELYESVNPDTPMLSSSFSSLVPGSSITMAIVLGQYVGSTRCPRPACGSHKSNGICSPIYPPSNYGYYTPMFSDRNVEALPDDMLGDFLRYRDNIGFTLW